MILAATTVRQTALTRRATEAAALFGLLGLAAAVVYLASGVRDPWLRSVGVAFGPMLTTAVLLRLVLATRRRALHDVTPALCPLCRYSLVGLASDGICPECGDAYHGGQSVPGEITLDRAALVRVLLAFFGAPLGVLLPVPLLALREGSVEAAVFACSSHDYAICAVIFVPHAMCSAVIGKFFSARVFAGYWLGGLGLGVAGLLLSMGIGGAESLGMRPLVMPLPGAVAGIGIAAGCVAGVLLATRRRVDRDSLPA